MKVTMFVGAAVQSTVQRSPMPPQRLMGSRFCVLSCSERWLLFGSDQDSNLEVLISIVGRCAYMCARASGADCGSDDPHRYTNGGTDGD